MWSWTYVNTVAMKRHSDGINVCFSNGSVRQVPAAELWNLKWTKDYPHRGTIDWLSN